MKCIFNLIKGTGVITGMIYRSLITILYFSVHVVAIFYIQIVLKKQTWQLITLVVSLCITEGLLNTYLFFNEHIRHLTYTVILDKFTDKIINADVHLFNKYSPGEIIHIWENIGEISNIIQLVFYWIKSFVTCIINIITLYLIIPSFSIISIIVFFVIGIVLYYLNNKWEKIKKEWNTIKTKRNCIIDESINGFMEIRNFSNISDYIKDYIHKANNKIYLLTKDQKIISAYMTLLIEVTSSIVTLVGLLMAISFINVGNMTIANGVTFIVYSWMFVDPAVNLVFFSADIISIYYIIPQFSEFMGFKNTLKTGNVELVEFNDKIEFKNVSFAYDKSTEVLKNINFTIHKGEHIGICGSSGSGKSTLIKLIKHLNDVNEGSILIDNIDVRDLTMNSIKKHICSVNQETFIFDGTIRDNILYSIKPNIVDDSLIWEACKDANLYKFIMKLPEKLDTNVGPRGLKLSGGQKQRISIARIFLANPDIVILDEATSSLDNESERKVKKAINMLDSKINQTKTIISIAHRLSTIQYCDKIYFIGDNHEIVESGTHEELLKLNAQYAHMWNSAYDEEDD